MSCCTCVLNVLCRHFLWFKIFFAILIKLQYYVCMSVYISVHAVTLQSTVATSTSTETCRPDSGLGEDLRQEEKARRNFQPISWELKRRYAMHYLMIFVYVKIGYQYSVCMWIQCILNGSCVLL